MTLTHTHTHTHTTSYFLHEAQDLESLNLALNLAFATQLWASLVVCICSFFLSSFSFSLFM